MYSNVAKEFQTECLSRVIIFVFERKFTNVNHSEDYTEVVSYIWCFIFCFIFKICSIISFAKYLSSSESLSANKLFIKSVNKRDKSLTESLDGWNVHHLERPEILGMTAFVSSSIYKRTATKRFPYFGRKRRVIEDDLNSLFPENCFWFWANDFFKFWNISTYVWANGKIRIYQQNSN